MTVRVVVLCALVALIAPACSQESAADSGQPAGKVIELTGTATATRAGVDRPLSVGSEVFADDEVVTAEGAELAIAIAHNGARWVLGGGQKRKLIESAAWRAEKGSEAAAALDSDDHARTAAAGRHSEREAAETAASATEENKQAEQAPAAAEAAASPPPAQAPSPPPAATPAPSPVEESPRPRAPERTAPTRTRRDEVPRERREGARANSSVGDAEVEAAAAPPPPANPEAAPIEPEPADAATSQRQTRGATRGAGTAAVGAAAAPEPRTFSVAVGSIEATGALTTAQARAQAGRLRGRIGLCAKLTVIGKMTVVLSVSAQGKVTAVKIESIEAALGDQFERCVLTRIRAAKFPAASGTTKVKLTITAKGE